MFHPDFRPRMPLRIIRWPHQEQKDFHGADFHELVADALEKALERGTLTPLEISDLMAESLLAVMSRHVPERVEDPFGIYDKLAELPAWVVQDIYNHLMAKEREDVRAVRAPGPPN